MGTFEKASEAYAMRDPIRQTWAGAIAHFVALLIICKPPNSKQGYTELMKLAGQKRSAIMCAEAVPWRCHRSLIADTLLTVHGGFRLHTL